MRNNLTRRQFTSLSDVNFNINHWKYLMEKKKKCMKKSQI